MTRDKYRTIADLLVGLTLVGAIFWYSPPKWPGDFLVSIALLFILITLVYVYSVATTARLREVGMWSIFAWIPALPIPAFYLVMEWFRHSNVQQFNRYIVFEEHLVPLTIVVAYGVTLVLYNIPDTRLRSKD